MWIVLNCESVKYFWIAKNGLSKACDKSFNQMDYDQLLFIYTDKIINKTFMKISDIFYWCVIKKDKYNIIYNFK